MNYIQKQATLQKLAQVRLAINYVLRSRMTKSAGSLTRQGLDVAKFYGGAGVALGTDAYNHAMTNYPKFMQGLYNGIGKGINYLANLPNNLPKNKPTQATQNNTQALIQSATPHEPGPGEKGYIDEKWKWMRNFDGTFANSPNRTVYETNTGKKPLTVENFTGGHFYDIPERLSKFVGDEDYLAPDDPYVQMKIDDMGEAYNQGSWPEEPGIGVNKWDDRNEQYNHLPPYMIESIQNANTPAEKAMEAQKWIFNRREPGYKPDIRDYRTK